MIDGEKRLTTPSSPLGTLLSSWFVDLVPQLLRERENDGCYGLCPVGGFCRSVDDMGKE
jgi:hypothetical protein